MAEFFETDEVVKGYDSKIAARILSYVKPYRVLIALTALALLLSTAGELFVPLIQQKVIDDAIMIRFYVVNEGYSADFISADSLSAESKRALELFNASKRSIEAGSRLFVPIERDTRISSAVEKELQQKGVLEKEDWYAFRMKEGSAAEEIVKSRPDIFSQSGDAAAVLKNNLYALQVREIAAIRANDISFIIRFVLILFAILCMVFFFTFFQTLGNPLL